MILEPLQSVELQPAAQRHQAGVPQGSRIRIRELSSSGSQSLAHPDHSRIQPLWNGILIRWCKIFCRLVIILVFL